MKTKEQKQSAIDSLAKAIPDASITIFTTFAREGEPGLSVSQLEELKAALRQAEGEYIVAKKRLVQKVLGGLNYDGIDVFGMDGSMGLVLGHGDTYQIAKALYQFAKANPSLKLFTGWMDGHALSYDEVMEMGTMPTRDELIARLLGMLNYPLRSLAIVLNQVAEQKKSANSQEPVAKSEEAAAGQEPAAKSEEQSVDSQETAGEGEENAAEPVPEKTEESPAEDSAN